MIKMVLRIPSIIALPIPRVKTPKRIFPVTLAAVIATSQVIALVNTFSGCSTLIISIPQSIKAFYLSNHSLDLSTYLSTIVYYSLFNEPVFLIDHLEVLDGEFSLAFKSELLSKFKSLFVLTFFKVNSFPTFLQTKYSLSQFSNTPQPSL